MTDCLRQQLDRWQMGELLRNYPGLRLSYVTASHVNMRGALLFSAKAPDKEQIADEYQIAIAIPHEFPQEVPSVREIAGRIPASFHKLNDGSLCLGSPTGLRLALLGSESIAYFVERCVVPYLYGYSYFEKHRTMPFGELTHGTLGLCQDLAPLYGTNQADSVPQFVRLSSMKKRKANKKPCPCGSRRRLGECHHRRVNALRTRLGRSWFRRILVGP